MYAVLKNTGKHLYVAPSLRAVWEPSFQNMRFEISMAVSAKVMVVWVGTHSSEKPAASIFMALKMKTAGS